MKKLFLLTALIALVNVENSFAAAEKDGLRDQLVVTDCKGDIRASAQVDPGTLSVVQVGVANTVGNASALTKVSLAQANREKKVSLVDSGSNNAVFASVTAGKWSACVEGSAITTVSITPSNTQSLSSLPLVGLSALGGGLAVAGIAGGSSSDNSTGSPVTSLVGQSSNVVGENQAANDSVTAAARTSSATACLNNQTPDPLSPFF